MSRGDDGEGKRMESETQSESSEPRVSEEWPKKGYKKFTLNNLLSSVH